MLLHFLIVAILLVAGTWASLAVAEGQRRKRALFRLRNNVRPRDRKQKPARQNLLESEAEARGFVATAVLEHLHLKLRVERLLETAGLKWGAAGLAHRCAAAFLGGYILATLATGNNMPPAAVAGGLLAGFLPLQYVRSKAHARILKFEEQFPDCLQFISRSMRAGHAFAVALGMVHKEFDAPLSTEFRRVFEEQNLGQSLDLVLSRLAQRIPSLDVQFFVSAVVLHKRTGGNLAELLDKLGGTIRERFKLRGHIRTLSAQGIMSGRVLSGIPVAVGGVMAIGNPGYIRFFFEDPLGKQLLMGCVVMQALGYVVMSRLVKIEV